jgi:hypothetical protein
MMHLTKKLLVALAAATLAGTGVAAVAALPATASASAIASASVQGTLFNGFGRGIEEDTALANAESAARKSALSQGFTSCDVFESTVSQDPRTRVFFAVVTVRCEDLA